MANVRQIYINLSVRDLKKSMSFFTGLGFEFNPQFTDENAACMVINPNAFVMLLAEPYFKTFTKRELFDGTKQTEVLLAISATSREEVDQTVKKAIAAGGKPATDPKDHGFMYVATFYDLDGHHWEVAWMDAKQMQS
jgi:uncharacterized protein